MGETTKGSRTLTGGDERRPRSRRRTRRVALAAAGAALGLATLAACAPSGGTGGTGGTGGGETDTKNHPPVKLSTNIQNSASTQWPAYDAVGQGHPGQVPLDVG